MIADPKDDSIARLFEIRKLSGQDRFAGEMTATTLETWAESHRYDTFEVINPQIHSRGELLAVTLLQGGAGQHRILIFCGALPELRVNRSQPRLAVFVGKRNPVLHLFNILRRMKIVRIQKQPAQSLGQKLSHSGFS